jgi:hypothetical protein
MQQRSITAYHQTVPNTLVHFAVQGAASRGLWPRLDPRWIYIGCLLPDVPWIVRRLAVALGAPVDPIDLRLYAMAQASLAGTLLLCGALAALAARARLAFCVLAANALLHLLLDACEVKWGNGVHLLAPFSWRMTSFDLAAGEGVLMAVLTAAGALVGAWEIVRPRLPVLSLELRPRRLAAAGALLAAYALAPLPLLGSVEESNSYSVSTLRQKERRAGSTIGLDRAGFRRTPGGGLIELWNGETVGAIGAIPEQDARVSLTGTFLQPDRLRVERFVEHRRQRDWPSYLALAMLFLLWARPSPSARRTSRR